MSTYSLQQIARLIPRDKREMILEENVIYKAVTSPVDTDMQILFTLWTTYVDRGGDLDIACSFCLADILNSFRQLQPVMLEMAKTDKLLDQ